MMKHMLVMFGLLSAVGMRQTFAEDTGSSDSLVWCGLDYSRVKMIGTEDFAEPSEIFPEMLDKWNSLFMKEMLPKLEKIAGSLRSDVKAVDVPNSKASEKKAIVREDGTREEMVTPSHITEKDIAASVKAYTLKHNEGMGMVFIVDRLVKVQKTGCLYVVFFDLKSRNVLYSERVCNEAAGAGFRNFWFKPIKVVIEKQLAGMYKKAKANTK